ncbi:hypothetical protein J4573_47520 [Actinomadura barringtoniae]|uniref:Uncharacterized protein n=1 Tax=Actinomadura barringtoniae TaxID=1427535 RepID=A0A939TFW5_9ACTN|nr:hypothetical protein [Actinomadura barringtoniae]MBO2454810.1 hypothetical protein [Actinomadura barringtoniae]
MAIAASFLWILNSCKPASPPDVAKVAHSERVNTSDKQATTLLSKTFDRLWHDQSWLAPQPSQAVLDQCESFSSGLIKTTWQPVTCTRSVKATAAFDGDFAAHNLKLHKALKSMGWIASGSAIPDVITNYYRPMNGRPQGSPAHAYGPSDLPDVTYSRAPQIAMNIRWLTRGSPLDLTSSPRSGEQTVTRENKQLDTQTVTKALRNHRYVIVFNLSSRYFDATQSPSPTTSPSTSYCACWSGNLCTCPGG